MNERMSGDNPDIRRAVKLSLLATAHIQKRIVFVKIKPVFRISSACFTSGIMRSNRSSGYLIPNSDVYGAFLVQASFALRLPRIRELIFPAGVQAGP
jgi:hypothetical protein